MITGTRRRARRERDTHTHRDREREREECATSLLFQGQRSVGMRIIRQCLGSTDHLSRTARVHPDQNTSARSHGNAPRKPRRTHDDMLVWRTGHSRGAVTATPCINDAIHSSQITNGPGQTRQTNTHKQWSKRCLPARRTPPT